MQIPEDFFYAACTAINPDMEMIKTYGYFNVPRPHLFQRILFSLHGWNWKANINT